MATVALAAGRDLARARVVIGHVAAGPQSGDGGRAVLERVPGRRSGPRLPTWPRRSVAGLDLTSSVRGSVWYKKRVLRGLVAEAAAELRAEPRPAPRHGRRCARLGRRNGGVLTWR